MNSVDNCLSKWVEERPDQILYTFLNGAGQVIESYTYRRFYERINYVAASLAETGKVRFGCPVLLVYPPGLEFIVAFFACVKLGAIPVPVPPPDASGFIGGVEKLAYITADCGAVAALTNQQYLQEQRSLTSRSLEAAKYLNEEPLCFLEWLTTDTMQGEVSDFLSRANPLLFLQYTSGSTQNPRGVTVSHQNVIHNCSITLDHQPIGVSWLPHYHDMGLIGYYLYIMISGGSVFGFSAFNFLKRPLLWLDTITNVGATITSAPNFAFEYCLREDKVPTQKLETLDLSSMRCMMNASEPVRSSVYTRFLAKFAPCGLSPRSLVVAYGLAENTLSVTSYGRFQLTLNKHFLERNQVRIEPPRKDGANQVSLVSCGKPLSGVEVQIVDPKAAIALGEDLIGEVWVGGESKAQGYWNKLELSQAVFNASIGNNSTAKTYLRTGDLGFIHDDELFVCGRLKDVIIIGGRNYYPTDIEKVVESCSPKIRQGCVAAFAIAHNDESEAIVVVAEVKRQDHLPNMEQICQEIRKRYQVDIEVLALVPHHTVAKTSSGKIARHQCKKLWQEGEMKVLASRQRPAKIKSNELIGNLLARFDQEGCEELTLGEVGVDSLTLVNLSLYIEELVNVQDRLSDAQSFEELFDLRILQAITVGELRSLLNQFSSNQKALKLAPETYVQKLRSIEKEERQLMQKDAKLPFEIAPPSSSRTVTGGKVFLTGATGFLGAFMLEALLRLTDFEVVTLVRAEDIQHAKARTEAALRRTGLWNEFLQEAFESRVLALNGNISQPKLGLSDKCWESLANEVSGLYHCGAEVDYVKPYQSSRSANVSGTVEIIRLASSGSTKVLHFASTTFIFGFTSHPILWESDRNTEMKELNFGYAQTKWVAEQLIYEAAQRGLSVKVYRPSLITASKQGQYVRRDIMARLLSYMIRYKVSIDAPNQVSFLPVDVCANNLIALSLIEEPTPNTFHLTADSYYNMQTVCNLISYKFGYSFRYVSIPDFIEHMNTHCSEGDPLFPLVPFFNQNYRKILQMSHKRYDNQSYRHSRDLSPLSMPEPSLEETVSGIVWFLQRENLIPAPLQASLRFG
jgi:thioester reductase-like protein